MATVNLKEKVLTVQELAKYLGMTYQATYRLVRQGAIPASKDGNRLFVEFAAAECWLDEKTRP